MGLSTGVNTPLGHLAEKQNYFRKITEPGSNPGDRLRQFIDYTDIIASFKPELATHSANQSVLSRIYFTFKKIVYQACLSLGVKPLLKVFLTLYKLRSKQTIEAAKGRVNGFFRTGFLKVSPVDNG